VLPSLARRSDPGQAIPAAVNPSSTALIFLSLTPLESFLKNDFAACTAARRLSAKSDGLDRCYVIAM
jgi:hypothetical protein